jgi:hypothetical protein
VSKPERSGGSTVQISLDPAQPRSDPAQAGELLGVFTSLMSAVSTDPKNDFAVQILTAL